MGKSHPSRLRFNFGFLLEAPNGTSRVVELNYPSIQISDDMTLEPLRGSFTATRISEGIYLSGRLQSLIIQQCVRCLEDAVLPLNLEIDELYYYPPNAGVCRWCKRFYQPCPFGPGTGRIGHAHTAVMPS